MGSELVPFHPICSDEVSRAIPKENPTPFLGVSRNFPLGNFPSVVELNGCLGLLPLVLGSTPFLLKVGPQLVLPTLIILPVEGVLRLVTPSVPTSIERF